MDPNIHCVSKKRANFGKLYSFDKHRLILIIFGTKHQHTFRNDTHVQLSLSLHFYLLYLLLNSCDGNDAFWRNSMLVKQSSSCSRKHRNLSLQICVCQTIRMTTWTDAGTCVHCTNTCSPHQPLWPATWSASLTHGQAYHKTSSMLCDMLISAHLAIAGVLRPVYIATQLNSTRRRVELSWVASL